MRSAVVRGCALAVSLTTLLVGSGGAPQAQAPQQEKSTKRVVTFKTEDGLTMHATLHLPAASPRGSMAGAVLFAEPGWVVRSTFDSTNVAPDLAGTHGMAVLTVDFRGTAGNLHGKLFELFTPAERERMQLDVRGAIEFLASQKGMDPARIGLLATGLGADYALKEAAENPAVQGVVLISGTLSDAAREFIEHRHDIPILCLAGKDDKEGVFEMAKAFSLSRSRDSSIILAPSGHGTGMFTRTKGLQEEVAAWLASNVKGLGLQTDITLDTPDGWTLRGKLRMPEVDAGTKVPGVVMVHGANHDQDTWYELSRALTKQGLATLVFDWRGKNRAFDDPKGHFGVTMSASERAKISLDVQTAVNFMAAQAGVDSTRIGLLAATAPTTDTLIASAGDSRIRTIAMLSQYQLNDGARKFLTTTDIPIFFVASIEDLNFAVGSLADFTKEAYRLSKNKETELLLYDDAGRGSEMLKTKPELEGMLVRWFVDKLRPKVPAPVTASR